MLTVETPASATDLVELATVKTQLGISNGDADDELNRLIDAASESIAEYLRYFPWQQTYTETLRGDSTPMLALSQMPVQSVTSVTIAGSLVTDYVIESAKAGILWRDAGWPRSALFGRPVDYHPIGGGQDDYNVSVEYVAGWLVPGDGSRDLPVSIEQAALETVIQWYGKGKGAEQSELGPVESVRMGDTAFKYASAGGTAVEPGTLQYAIPSRALSLLHPYRRQP